MGFGSRKMRRRCCCFLFLRRLRFEVAALVELLLFLPIPRFRFVTRFRFFVPFRFLAILEVRRRTDRPPLPLEVEACRMPFALDRTVVRCMPRLLARLCCIVRRTLSLC